MVTSGEPVSGTGGHAVRVEVIDTVDSSKTCSDLADFPIGEYWPPLGGMVDSKIIICGGHQSITGSGYSKECHTYKVRFPALDF